MKKLRITNYKLRIIKILCVLCVLCGSIFSQGLPIAAPQTVGMSAERLNQIDALIEKDIADKKLPGAVVIVGRKGKIVYRKAFGNRSLIPTVEKMTVDTIFRLGEFDEADCDGDEHNDSRRARAASLE